ncbi:MAG: A/G-specific adenine glycosylase [Bacteroidota bacterium]
MKNFSSLLCQWYEQNKRDLPWRNTTDPYKIWLSEIILQQTRVAQGLPYYEKFVKELPTVFDFADASEERILRLWQGLGYYSRARNMHTTAKKVAHELDGNFPDSYKELLKLKGVGTYTAAAIASFAFGEKVAVVDGNVYRVLARVFGIKNDIASSPAKKEFFELAQNLISGDDPATHNQAIMEFGACYFTPKKPKCSICTFKISCIAYRDSLQSVLPVKNKKTKVRERYFHYLIFERGEQMLLKPRPAGDIWQGLYDFFLLEGEKWKSETELQAICPSGILGEPSAIHKHQLSHQRLWVRFWRVEVEKPEVWQYLREKYMLQAFTEADVEALPKPILIKNYLDARGQQLFS